MRHYLKTVLWIIIIMAFLLSSFAYAEENCLGLRLPKKSVKVDTNRYQLSLDFKAAEKFYRKTYRGISSIKKTDKISVPGVKVIHYKNITTKKNRWTGANLSSIKGKIYVYCYIDKDTSN